MCLEVMAAIPRLNIDSSQMASISDPELTQNSEPVLLFSGIPTRAIDYWLRSLPSSALPVSLSLSTTSPLKSHCKESPKGSWSLVSSPHLQHRNKELLWLFVIATTMATFTVQAQPV